MKPLLTYYGGKQKLAPIINEIIPRHTLYAEPFSGGAAVFFYKRPSTVEVINDTNGELINFYKVVKENFDALQMEVAKTLHSRFQHERAWIVYNYPDLFDPVKRAWAVWVLCTMGFAARMDGSFGFDLSENTTSRKIDNNRNDFVKMYSRRLEKVQIECENALYIIKSRDSPGSFFYCDPPYYNSDMGHYKGYTKQDFTDLLVTLSRIEGRFLLSSYPSRILEEFVKEHNWNQEFIEQTVTVNIKSGKGKPKTEVLTANYPLIRRNQLVLF